MIMNDHKMSATVNSIAGVGAETSYHQQLGLLQVKRKQRESESGPLKKYSATPCSNFNQPHTNEISPSIPITKLGHTDNKSHRLGQSKFAF